MQGQDEEISLKWSSAVKKLNCQVRGPSSLISMSSQRRKDALEQVGRLWTVIRKGNYFEKIQEKLGRTDIREVTEELVMSL